MLQYHIMNIYIYIYIYVCVCVCMCVRARVYICWDTMNTYLVYGMDIFVEISRRYDITVLETHPRPLLPLFRIDVTWTLSGMGNLHGYLIFTKSSKPFYIFGPLPTFCLFVEHCVYFYLFVYVHVLFQYHWYVSGK